MSKSRGGKFTDGIKTLIIFFVALSVSVLIGEFALRFLFRDITTTWDNLSYYAIKWNKEHVRLNSMGFREREVAPAKPNGVYRIVVIGDSFAFGQGIPEERMFSKLLEGELKKKNSRYEVLNFAERGANIAEEIRILNLVLSKVDPDFVLLAWFVNDVETKPPKAKNTGSDTYAYRIWRWIKLSSAFYFIVHNQWQTIRDKYGVSDSYPDSMMRRFGDPSFIESGKAEANMVEFIRTCRSRNVPLGIVMFPQLVPSEGKPYPFEYLHKRVSGWCVREGIPQLDLYDTYSAYMKDVGTCKKLWANRFDPHPGTFAHQLAAGRILDVFGPAWQ